MQYLGVIEQRTNELFQLYSTSSVSDKSNSNTFDVGNPTIDIEATVQSIAGTVVNTRTATHTPSLKIAPPGVDDLDAGCSEDDEDDDARPLSLGK